MGCHRTSADVRSRFLGWRAPLQGVANKLMTLAAFTRSLVAGRKRKEQTAMVSSVILPITILNITTTAVCIGSLSLIVDMHKKESNLEPLHIHVYVQIIGIPAF